MKLNEVKFYLGASFCGVPKILFLADFSVDFDVRRLPRGLFRSIAGCPKPTSDAFNCKLWRCWHNAATGITLAPALGRRFIVK